MWCVFLNRTTEARSREGREKKTRRRKGLKSWQECMTLTGIQHFKVGRWENVPFWLSVPEHSDSGLSDTCSTRTPFSLQENAHTCPEQSLCIHMFMSVCEKEERCVYLQCFESQKKRFKEVSFSVASCPPFDTTAFCHNIWSLEWKALTLWHAVRKTEGAFQCSPPSTSLSPQKCDSERDCWWF